MLIKEIYFNAFEGFVRCFHSQKIVTTHAKILNLSPKFHRVEFSR